MRENKNPLLSLPAQEGIYRLTEALCALVGPSGMEEEVRSYIADLAAPLCDALHYGSLGSLTALYRGSGTSDKRVMVSAHMDEVGFMIREITEEGLLYFEKIGGFDSRVLCGKAVTVYGRGGAVSGVISSLPLHLRSEEEADKVTEAEDMYIDIGASSRYAAEELVSIGDCAVFDSEFVRFGEGGYRLKGRAIDDRLGCALMLRVLARLHREGIRPAFDVHFCFGSREELGFSGTLPEANRIAPTHAIVLETTAVADLSDVPAEKRAAALGRGGVISLFDRATLYGSAFTEYARAIAEEGGIPYQVKNYLAGGNDAAHIQRSGAGVAVLALSAPTRYLHSPACVMDIRDGVAMEELLYRLLTSELDMGRNT